MITEEERVKLKKGDIIYECVFGDDEELVSKREIGRINRIFIYSEDRAGEFRYNHIKSEHLFMKESDAIKYLISFHKEQIIEINDEITELNNQLESLENGSIKNM